MKNPSPIQFLSFFFFPFFEIFYFLFFKLYIIVLVLPNIKMNPPQVYMCSPSWTLLPPHTIPLGRPSAPAPSIQHHASNLDWRLVSHMILYMFQCHSPKSSHPLPLPQSPKDCCIHLCLFCCLTYRVIVTRCMYSPVTTTIIKIQSIWDFHGGPVPKPGLPVQGLGFDPWSGN